jgi:orotate phosphoribosyltransferase
MQKPILELRDLLQRQSIRRGHFVLASGATSNYYCNSKATTLSPRGARLTGEILFKLLADREVEAVGGLALGATFIATAVALVSDQRGHPIYGFTVRSSQKEHGLKSSVEEAWHPDGKPLLSPLRRVAVVDDVVTQGGSVLQAVDTVKERGCEIALVVALVDRNAGGAERIRARGLEYVYLFRTDGEGNLIASDLADLSARAAQVSRSSRSEAKS